MNRLIVCVLTWPKCTIAVLVAITLALSYGMTKLEFDSSFEVFLPQHDDEYLFYNETKTVFGDSSNLIIMRWSWVRPMMTG